MVDVSTWIGVVGGLVGGAAAVYTVVRARSGERHRATLPSKGDEHKVQLGRLQERRVAVVAELYEKLVAADGAFSSWKRPLQLAGDASMEEKAQRAVEAGHSFRSTFLRNRIWLDEDLCRQIEAFQGGIYEAYVEFASYDPDDSSTKSEHAQAWRYAWDKVSNQVPMLREEIETRFREMLGTTDPP